MNLQLKQDLVAFGHSLGFERIGITSVEPLAREGQYLETWLEEGRAGEMDYMHRNPERRSQPQDLLAGARSVIVMAMNYEVPSSRLTRPSPEVGEGSLPSPFLGEVGRSGGEGKIARYAYGRDYHKVIGKRLQSFVRYVEALAPGTQCRTYVDTGPVLERGLAQRAGLGFVGKNTMLITKGLGSWVFLASVITTLDLPLDSPDTRSCGSCRLCIDACPTEAITAPFELDARRCIAYLTIEKDGPIPEELRAKMGGWIFGCDICQEVCPHNARSIPSSLPSVSTGVPLRLKDILSMKTEEEFSQKFNGTSLMRAGRESLVRNACVVAANLERTDLKDCLLEISKNDSSLIVQEYAAWALKTLGEQRFSIVPPVLSRNPVQP